MRTSTLKTLARMMMTGALVAALGGLAACGAEGPQGKEGEQGPEGESGQDGANSLVETEEVEPGDDCPAGGVRVASGIDENDDGELSEDETDSTQVVCNSPTADCTEFEVDGIEGTDQTYYEGVQSDPITVNHDGGDKVEFELASSRFNAHEGSEADQLSLTPNRVGGPFQVTLIAHNECTVETKSFVVERVEPAVADTAAVHLYGEQDQLDMTRTGESEALFSFAYGEADGPVSHDPDTYEFDLVDEDDGVIATSEALDFQLGQDYTVAAYPDESAEANFLQIEDNWSDPSEDGHARLRPVNLNPAHSEVDIVELDGEDDESSLFEAVPYGEADDADSMEADIERLGVDTDGDSEANATFTVDGDAIAAGDSANLFVHGDADSTRVTLQHLGDDAQTHNLPLEPTYEESFEADELPGDFSTGGSSEWTIDTDEASDADNSATVALDTNQSSYLEFDLEVDSPGQLRFDWKTDAENGDELGVCIDDSENCTSGEGTEETITGQQDWTESSLTFDEAGTYTISWGVVTSVIAPSGGDFWVDNIRFMPE